MSSQDQSKYIADLVVLKTKEFKEVKELLSANEIISADAEIVKTAQSIDEITHALTDQQASKFIDVLIATKEPERGRVYSKKRVEQASSLVDDIKSTIAGWTF
jgi:tRNA G37 N-methylase Trm5